MKYWWCVWWISIGAMLMPKVVRANDNERYLAVLLLNLDRRNDVDLDILEDAVKAGCNAVHLTIHWDQVYPSISSQPDWQKYDTQIALAQKLGVKIALRIYLGRNEGRIQGFWTADQRQHDQQGKPLVAGYASTFFSYAHRPSVEKAREFIKEVCQRYVELQKQGKISWVSVCSTPTQETGYYHENNANGSPYATVFDYSPSMKEEFKIWASRKYQKIARLNVAWQTQYNGFEEVVPPTSLKNRDQIFWGDAGKDWYIFRHIIFKQFIEQTTQTIKSVHPQYRVITDFGSVFDQLSSVCGSLAFRDLNLTTDGVKINNDVHYDHRFSIDVLRSNVLVGQWVLNEVFPDFRQGQEPVVKQIDENFTHGARWISIVIGTRNILEQMRPIIQKAVPKWLQVPFTPPQPKSFMTYNLSQVLEFGYFSGGVYSEWSNKAGPASNRQPVEIRMVEDLLADSLRGSINRHPFVKNALPTKTIRVNSSFSYKLSSEVFGDLDGLISSVEAINLPNWLSFQGGVFRGIPNQIGTYSFTLKATDDDGASIETPFTIMVNEVGVINRPPTIKKPYPEAIGLYKQPLIFTIKDSIFMDSDGFISRIEIEGLPPWAQYRNGEIRGLADTVGVYLVMLRAYDDEEAMVSTTLKISINYPTVFFDLIKAGRPGERILLKRLRPNDRLLEHELPPYINVYSSCDAIFDTFVLELTGSQSRTVYTDRSPFSLYEGDLGLPAIAGKYILKGTAYFKKDLIASTIYEFEILPTDPTTRLPTEIDDWSVYPNPALDFINIKLPVGNTSPPIRLVSLLGAEIGVPERAIFRTEGLISLNLRQLKLVPGMYLLKLQTEDATWRTFKVIKQ